MQPRALAVGAAVSSRRCDVMRVRTCVTVGISEKKIVTMINERVDVTKIKDNIGIDTSLQYFLA